MHHSRSAEPSFFPLSPNATVDCYNIINAAKSSEHNFNNWTQHSLNHATIFTCQNVMIPLCISDDLRLYADKDDDCDEDPY